MHNYSSLIEGQKQGQAFSVMVLGNPDAAHFIQKQTVRPASELSLTK